VINFAINLPLIVTFIICDHYLRLLLFTQASEECMLINLVFRQLVGFGTYFRGHFWFTILIFCGLNNFVKHCVGQMFQMSPILVWRIADAPLKTKRHLSHTKGPKRPSME
jgi:hypothetical protein